MCISKCMIFLPSCQMYRKGRLSVRRKNEVRHQVKRNRRASSPTSPLIVSISKSFLETAPASSVEVLKERLQEVPFLPNGVRMEKYTYNNTLFSNL